MLDSLPAVICAMKMGVLDSEGRVAQREGMGSRRKNIGQHFQKQLVRVAVPNLRPLKGANVQRVSARPL